MATLMDRDARADANRSPADGGTFTGGSHARASSQLLGDEPGRRCVMTTHHSSESDPSTAVVRGTVVPNGQDVEARASVADPEVAPGVSRRTVLRWGAIAGVAVGLAAAEGTGAPFLRSKGLLSADGAFAASSTALGDLLFYTEAFPTSPLILEPFKDYLPIPKALAPVPKSEFSSWAKPPGPGPGQQNSLQNERHQIWSPVSEGPDPIVYKIDLLLRTHSFTTSKVLPINAKGRPTVSFDAAGKTYAAGTTRS